MDYRIFNNIVVLRIDRGEEVVECINDIVIDNDIRLGTLTGIAASNNIEAGLFDTETKIYNTKTFKDEDFEVTSLVGNITTKDNKPYLHLHINFSDKNFNAYGGHLSKCVISGACEIFITIIDGNVGRKSSNIGLNIFDFEI